MGCHDPRATSSMTLQSTATLLSTLRCASLAHDVHARDAPTEILGKKDRQGLPRVGRKDRRRGAAGVVADDAQLREGRAGPSLPRWPALRKWRPSWRRALALRLLFEVVLPVFAPILNQAQA